MSTITTKNHGPLLESSTYWQNELAERGLYYASPNAGCLRLLVPDSRRGDIAEMRTGKTFILTIGEGGGQFAGRRMAEILFDDRTASPFALHLSYPDQFERGIVEADYGKAYTLEAYEDRRGTPHRVLSSRKLHLRRAPVPCLKPWQPPH